MVDITMCKNEECSKKETCYRYKAPTCEYRQSYFYPSPKEEECTYFMKIWNNGK